MPRIEKDCYLLIKLHTEHHLEPTTQKEEVYNNNRSKMLFGVNEKILCFHVGLLYEAKVLKAENWTGDDNLTKAVGPHYFVHYMGWRARWDEWVPESRMLKLNEDNIQKQKALAESVKAAREAKMYEGSGSTSKPSARKSGSNSVTAGINGNSASLGRESSETQDLAERRKTKESRGTKRGRDAVEQVGICEKICSACLVW